MTQRVLITTPTTLLATLWAVAYGWQQERVAESAQAISSLGRELHTRLIKLSDLLARLGSRLNSTVNAFNDTIGSYERRILPAARRFADHGAVAEGSELSQIEQVTSTARSLAVSELESGAMTESESAVADSAEAGALPLELAPKAAA